MGENMKKWKCMVCNYVHAGEEPPDKCPVCGADKSLFVLLEEGAAGLPPEKHGEPVYSAEHQHNTQAARAEPKNENKSEPPAAAKQDIPLPAWKRFTGSVYGQQLTRYHGHPIAVHIPNGVLPVGVFFTLLAAIFKSETLSIAAQYDIGFVALTMPIVIGTGLNDWVNSFKARMTRVFKIKMISAAIVTALSVLLALWGMVRPGIYHGSLSESWFFLLLHIANLTAAIVAGWYGGKLVFRK
jgi:rubredoxin/uncharacterized membrane protein